MAQQEFIPYEQALQLKELGFDEGYYFARYADSANLIPREEEDGWAWHLTKSAKAPLYQQAFRWFREKKLSDSCVCRYQGKNDGGIYYYYVITKDFGVEETRHFKEGFSTYEEAELACLKKLIEIVKNK